MNKEEINELIRKINNSVNAFTPEPQKNYAKGIIDGLRISLGEIILYNKNENEVYL